MKLLFICIVLLLLSAFQGFSADSTRSHSHYLSASLFSHSVSLPFSASNRLVALNRLPGMRIEAGKYLGKGLKRLRNGYTASIAAYHQKELHYGYELGGSLLSSYSLHKRLTIVGTMGLAYLHTFEDATLYKQDGTSRVAARDWGRPQFNGQISLGCQTRINHRYAIRASYFQILQMPFARKSGVFFIPHSRVSLGLCYNFSV